MANQTQKYETQKVKVLRGLEAKKISEFEKDGWELISQEKGKLRSELSFRRPKKPISKSTILGGLALVLIGVLGITYATLSETAVPSNQSSETSVKEGTETKNDDEVVDSATEEEQVLTVENSQDLKTLLSNSNDNTYEFWDEFYKKYKSRTIEFDGNIALMEKNPDFDYTYDVLIEAGDYSETSSIGAPFRALRVVVPFGWKKTDQDDQITQGTNVRVVAKIWDYNEGQSFDIKLVSTTVR
jgi:WD40 repeat protein